VEAMRQPICLLLTTAALVLVIVMPILITHAMDDKARIVRDSALAVHLVAGLILGSYAACAALVREIRRATVSSILSKPINRTSFFLAKFLGVAAFMGLFSLGMAITTLLASRVAGIGDEHWQVDTLTLGLQLGALALAYLCGGLANYLRQRSFHSMAFASLLALLAAVLAIVWVVDATGNFGRFPSMWSWSIVPVSLLVAVAITVLTGLAVALAPRFDTVPTLSVCLVALMVGLVSDYFFRAPAAEGAVWARVLYSVVPNWQHFWVVDALAAGGIANGYVAQACLYAAFYLAAILALGIAAFERMDMK
jgi:ABC-type transport system involved in multi-copper enzyme maturation permease subunit